MNRFQVNEFCPIIATIRNKRSQHLLHQEDKFYNFIFYIRKTRKLSPNRGFIFMTNNYILSGTQTVGEIYEKFKSKDDLLYIDVVEESIFG
jgi:hypothetical protein